MPSQPILKPSPLLISSNRKGGLEKGQTSRNHRGLILRTMNTADDPMAIPAMAKPIDARRRQYGATLVYGSSVESTGGSVVQNAEMVASNRVAYRKLKSRH